MFTPIDFQTEDAVWVSRNLYCKTPEALEIVLQILRNIGYTVQDQRVDGYAIQEGRTTPEQMEQHGWSLWYARLEDIDRGKCLSCNSYISRQGIRMHGHQCEVCGEVTYLDMTKDSTVRFRFKNDDRGWLSSDLHMTVLRWDTDEGYLYLKWEFDEGGWGTMNRDESLAYLDNHIGEWIPVEENGQQIMKVCHPLRHWGDPVDEDDAIEVKDIWGHRFNYKEVRLWEEKEYSEYDPDFPIPQSISIYESWHWAPLPASPILHEELFSAVNSVSSKDYWYQDGRPAFSLQLFQEMGKFVRHFTELDADAWDVACRRFRLDGPGGIDDVAAFCHPNAMVRDEPNIGNFLVGATKLMSGQPLVGNEAASMAHALEDCENQEVIKSLFSGDPGKE